MTPHITDIKVRGYHIDLYGHVNNSRYLEFLEAARTDFITDNLDWELLDALALVLTNVNITYRRPAVFGDTLRVETTLIGLRSRNGTARQRVYRQADKVLLAEAEVSFMVVDHESGTVRRISGNLKEQLERLVCDD